MVHNIVTVHNIPPALCLAADEQFSAIAPGGKWTMVCIFVDYVWQEQKVPLFGKGAPPIRGKHGTKDPVKCTRTQRPTRVRKIEGDGNCLFRRYLIVFGGTNPIIVLYELKLWSIFQQCGHT